MRNFELMIAIKNDILENIDSVKFDFGSSIPEGHEYYLKDFFANNPRFNDSQEQFDMHIGFVNELFNEYIY